MTAGELKFALEVEFKLNRVPQPEYRQLLVETLMVLAIIAENDPAQSLGGILNLNSIVEEANRLFLKEQVGAGKVVWAWQPERLSPQVTRQTKP